jgi:MarR family transcriptional regulator, temperature-dependent positive regulator of motility
MADGREGVGRSPIHLLHRAAQSAELIFNSSMTRGVTSRHLAVLIAVEDQAGASQTDITERTGIDRSTLADIVRRLAKSGYLKRRRSRTDTRANELRLTDEGREVLAAAEPLAKRVDTRVLEAIPAAQRDGFVGALRTIIEALEGIMQKSNGDERSAFDPAADANGLPSRNDILGFAMRARENLRCIEEAFKASNEGHVVTQLICSLLGLIVFPQQRVLDRCQSARDRHP